MATKIYCAAVDCEYCGEDGVCNKQTPCYTLKGGRKVKFVRFEKYNGVEVWINPLTVAWLIQGMHDGYTVVAFLGDNYAFVDVKGELMDVMDRLTDA